MRYLRGKQRGAVMKKKRRLFLCCLMTLLMTFVMAVPVGVSAETGEDANADKAIKVEYDGETYYFDHFGSESENITDEKSLDNGLNVWLMKNTEKGKTITITLQKNITGIGLYYMASSKEVDDWNQWGMYEDNRQEANLNIPEERPVVLNMNGHTISGSGQTDSWARGLISNLGYLSINGEGTLENQDGTGYVIYSGNPWYKDASLSLNNITVKHGENPANASVYAQCGTIDSIESCTFINSGGNGAIYISSDASIGTIKDCIFNEGIRNAICINAGVASKNPVIETIDGCTINCSYRAILGVGNAFLRANIGTIETTSITASNSAVWGVRYIATIDDCNIEVTDDHETSQGATASKILQTTYGIGKITGDTSVKGKLAIPIYASGGSVTIESGTFESDFDTVVYVGDTYSNNLTILGGTYINGENALDVGKDVPVVLAGDNDIVYPFGKTLDEWQEDKENTFTLDYDKDKIAEDTAAALTAIENEQDSDTKAELAKTLQQNINAITDEGMRTTAQTQADTKLKETNGTVTITLIDGDTSQEITVANGSIPAIADPQKENYEFKGWYTDKALSTPYEAGEIKDKLTLYAKWEEIHKLEHHEAVAATCEEAGNIEYWSCSVCGNNFEDEAGNNAIEGDVVIPALEHNWSGPVWTWKADHSSATATFTCENNPSHVQTLTATATSEIIKDATETEVGEIKYSASIEFEGNPYTTYEIVKTPATGTGTPTDPTNPVDPTDPTDPANPSDSTVPAEGTESGSTQNTDANAQTGDEFNMGILLAAMALAGTAAAGTVVIRRRNG